jgi:quercetin dioxygenase-like cupin family protein
MNVLENIPYNNKRLGSRRVADEKYIQIMQLALKQGQNVPRHNANSNVHLLMLKGSLTINLHGKDNNIKEGDLLPVAYRTPMIIQNSGTVDATFLVLKTPNPSEMQKEAAL